MHIRSMTEAAAVVAVVVAVMFTSPTTTPHPAASKGSNIALPPRSPFKDYVDYRDINTFGLRLLRSLSLRGSVLISPLSLWSTMVLALYGAELLTQHEMEEVLHVLNVRKYDLLRFLDSVEESPLKVLNESDVVIMEQKSKVFKDQDFALGSRPERELEDRLCSVNFSMPEETTKKINEFLKEITYNLMPSLVNPNQLRGTLMAMETGGTFKSHWRFNCEKNCINPFYPLPYSAPINVTMIWVKQLLPVGMDPHLRAMVVRMPFYHRMSLYLILPLYIGEKAFQDTLNALDSWSIRHALEWLDCYRIEVHVPRIKMHFEYSNDIMQCLIHLGARSMFDPERADFSYFGDAMYTTDLNHDSYLEINETMATAGMASNLQLKSADARIPYSAKTLWPSSRSRRTANADDINMPLNKDSKKLCRKRRSCKGNGDHSIEAQWERKDDTLCNMCLKFNRPFIFLLVDDTDNIIWQVGVYKTPLN
ncbi:intracellular coagulation inhibitor 3-like [Portunus trituberculatus]|uniref:intracellular coagulation inhibitor 3-like n=1 Tax=Portunus trituberculatus TaxID=210409 RepID=UPI001E1CD54F|nr:intracellular coagulation inhibitor 3-like [Portunus trituberculatus]